MRRHRRRTNTILPDTVWLQPDGHRRLDKATSITAAGSLVPKLCVELGIEVDTHRPSARASFAHRREGRGLGLHRRLCDRLWRLVVKLLVELVVKLAAVCTVGIV